MFFATQEKAIEAIVSNLPYPDQIRNWDLSISSTVRFTWRGSTFCVTLSSGSIQEVEDKILTTSDVCILMRELIKRPVAVGV